MPAKVEKTQEQIEKEQQDRILKEEEAKRKIEDAKRQEEERKKKEEQEQKKKEELAAFMSVKSFEQEIANLKEEKDELLQWKTDAQGFLFFPFFF